MLVKLRLQLNFKRNAPKGKSPFEMELPSGATVGRALEMLSIPAESPKVILVNGRMAVPGRELEPGDELTVFPPLEGG